MKIQEVIARGNERALIVLRRRENGETLRAIATSMGVTSERIRQMDAKGRHLQRKAEALIGVLSK